MLGTPRHPPKAQPSTQHGCPAAARRVPLTLRRRPSAPARASSSSSAHSLPALPAATPRQARQSATTATTTATTTSTALAAPTPQEAVDILFAGYSDIAERLQAAHQRIEQLEKGAPPGPTGGSAGAGAGGASAALASLPSSSLARQPWDAAMFLLFFLGFINVAGWVALWQAQAAIGAASAPWWLGAAASRAAPPAPLFAVALKRLVLFFVPLTNTAVVLTFCAAAVRAALACLRAWE